MREHSGFIGRINRIWQEYGDTFCQTAEEKGRPEKTDRTAEKTEGMLSNEVAKRMDGA